MELGRKLCAVCEGYCSTGRVMSSGLRGFDDRPEWWVSVAGVLVGNDSTCFVA